MREGAEGMKSRITMLVVVSQKIVSKAENRYVDFARRVSCLALTRDAILACGGENDGQNDRI
jgi:hypothetical protein